ncbi:MAG TPA: hypothetical protein VLJ58_20115 [Ramlibacter sp.]|nr:hypothetical protein [Ramlibacter sp.]
MDAIASEDSTEVSRTERRSPVAYVLRWVVGIVFVGQSLYAAYGLSASWEQVKYISVGEPYFPYALIIAAFSKLLTGILLLTRTRYVFAPFVLWCAAFAYMFLVHVKWSQIPAQVFFTWMEQLALLVFLVWLASRREIQ